MEEHGDIPALSTNAADFRLHVDIKGWLKEDSTLTNQDIKERLIKRIEDEYAESRIGRQTGYVRLRTQCYAASYR